MTTTRCTLVAATTALLTLAASTAFAQGFPSKPVTLIVPNPPGGVVDTSARLLSEPLAKRLGQSVVIENKGGASGNIARRCWNKRPASTWSMCRTKALAPPFKTCWAARCRCS